MMQHLPGKRVLALVIGLAAAAVGSAYAQDTTETGQATIDTMAPEPGAIDTSAIDTSAVDTSATRDTTDTSGVQNPPEYRGMERDTTVFPDSGSPAADTGAVENQATGTDTTSVGDTEPMRENPAGGDTAGQAPDSTQ
jgi:hypothetical protein